MGLCMCLRFCASPKTLAFPVALTRDEYIPFRTSHVFFVPFTSISFRSTCWDSVAKFELFPSMTCKKGAKARLKQYCFAWPHVPFFFFRRWHSLWKFSILTTTVSTKKLFFPLPNHVFLFRHIEIDIDNNVFSIKVCC